MMDDLESKALWRRNWSRLKFEIYEVLDKLLSCLAEHVFALHWFNCTMRPCVVQKFELIET